MRAVIRELPRRSIVLLAALLVGLLALPLAANDYQITVLILILYLAYLGQAWNIMMGFAGLLSLGHALYVGLAAYLSALLFKDFGISPWLGLLAAMPLAAAAGAMISVLAFRFRVTGVYFAILTIAFAEFARIGFDHLAIVNGSGGLFLPVAPNTQTDLWLLRGPPVMFYYLILAATVVAAIVSRVLLARRIGYFWLPIREDEAAARATGVDTFRYKTAAVAISAAMTAFAGVFYAFYYNNLFPDQVFGISRSIELIIGPIIGGLGTIIGPLVGAFLLTGLSELLTGTLSLLGLALPGARQLLYGLYLLLVILVLPGGVWPFLARRLRFDGEGP